MPSPIYVVSAIALGCFVQGISGQITISRNNDGSKNCPGVLQISGNDDGYCCVGGELDLSTCEGWPICTGSSWKPKTVSCATKVPVTAQDYDARIESASSKYLRDTEATTTSDFVPLTTTTSNINDNDETTASVTRTSDSSTTTNGTGAIDTAGTSSGASPTETNNTSNIKITSLVGVVGGTILAIWMAI